MLNYIRQQYIITILSIILAFFLIINVFSGFYVPIEQASNPYLLLGFLSILFTIYNFFSYSKKTFIIALVLFPGLVTGLFIYMRALNISTKHAFSISEYSFF